MHAGPPVADRTLGGRERRHRPVLGRCAADRSTGTRVARSTTNATPATTSPLAEEAGCDILFAPLDDASSSRAEPMTTVSLPAMSSGVPSSRTPRTSTSSRWRCASSGTCSVRAATTSARRTGSSSSMFQRLADDLVLAGRGASGARRSATTTAWPSRAATRSSRPSSGRSPRCSTGRCAPCRDAALARYALGGRARAVSSPRPSAAPDCVRYFTVVEAGTMTPLDVASGSVRLLASIELGDRPPARQPRRRAPGLNGPN